MTLPAVPFAESFDLEAAFDDVSEYWSPKVVAQVNDQYVKVAKVHGRLVWHDHVGEDELFFVVRGHLKIEYEGGRVVDLPAGSMHVVPRGTLHNPIAEEECWIVLIEPVQTKHTGDVQSPLTRTLDEQLGQPQPR
ncbi:cupin domain-containing protein [Burkholderia vietnamiensis]|uniref:cupin domain-containing protein n=1 Tax=Burkholderia vietnamiensis TaxID=60552 RepID=UPI00075F0C17|nr:cupin domain-containing protein [Burkholderia vietnamiensis]KVE60515.1 cupin [Burkholderia vietnamiensis]KVE83194.1 cupin [Burkholderia vietnamiensis]MDN7928548.1 cupin domain-containing protein [Burkholderia vietnamiensis]HDR9251841.1 cupin domain-containing protein [Burkholderia vietnamiensis]